MPTPTTLPQSPILPTTPAGLARAAQLIADGHLVVLPTETVYGIAVNLLSPHATAAARTIKGAAPHWVLHVATPDDLLTWVPHISPLGRRLITKSLPGPIAYQIKLTPEDAAAARTRLGNAQAAAEALLPNTQDPSLKTQDFSLTLRCPECPETQKILAAAAVPIAIIGAGTPAQPGVFELSDLPDGLLIPEAGKGNPMAGDGGDGARPGHGQGEKNVVVAAIDGGPTRYRRSSTVVQIDGEQFSVIRPGVIDDRIIQKLADFVILFVCSGNTCRSPMAASIATQLLAEKLGIHPSELPLRHIVVQSAGVHASRGMRATKEAIEAANALGADLSSHLSQPTSHDLLRRADLIYTMTDAHRDELVHLLPWVARKTERLDPAGDVPDPIGSDLSVYKEVAEHLAELLKHRLRELRI